MSPTSLELHTKINLIVALMSLPIVILGWIYVGKSEEGVAHKEVYGIAQATQPVRHLTDEGAVRRHVLPHRYYLL
ncbi:MAG: hypothetical protein H6Q99_2342 [Proteobacteria bacterium]|nr:hypothetical protein [Pseudomonadota bacterium]